MREYAKVTPAFWIGTTGRQLRGDADAQLVAVYVLTAPTSNMIGVFYLPVATIAHDTGLPLDVAAEALRRVCDVGFASYDEASGWLWVHEMAHYQIEPSLAPKDKRVIGIAREFEKLPDGPMKQGFYERYRAAFHLPNWRSSVAKSRSPFEAPCKPHRSQEQEQDQHRPSQGEEIAGLGAVGRAARLAVVGSGGSLSAGRVAR